MRRQFGILALASTAALLLTAPPTAAAGPGSYAVTQTHNARFTPLTTNNLVTNSAPGVATFDTLYNLSTTGTGIHRLPFPLHLYNSTYRSIAISTNGNVQPGTAPTVVAAPWNQKCLPNLAFGRTALMAFYFSDSLGYVTNAGQGVFTRTKGRAPHRTFTVSWQGFESVSAPTSVNVQMIFTEGSQTVRYVYGPMTSQYLVVVGLQSKDKASSTQVHCGELTLFPGTAGLQLTFTHLN